VEPKEGGDEPKPQEQEGAAKVQVESVKKLDEPADDVPLPIGEGAVAKEGEPKPESVPI
jgi:hypothetical protein